MQVSVSKQNGLEYQVTVEVPGETVEQQIRERLMNLARSVKLDGFRPGKVPVRVIEKRYGERVRAEVRSEMVEKTFREALQQENLRPAGRPRIEPGDFRPGGALSYTAVFEVYPEFDVQLPAGSVLTRPVVEITDEDVDRVIGRMRKQHIHYHPVDRPAQEGDRLIVDFVGRIDGETFEGGEARAFPLVIGSNTLVPGFEEQLLGLRTGDEKVISVQFPADYHVDTLAGQTVSFDVTVQAVEEPHLPEVDDAFAARFDVEGGLAELREKVRESLRREADQAIKRRIKSDVLEKLLEANPIPLPQSLIDEEISTRRRKAEQELERRGKVAADIELNDEMFEADAKRSVQLGLILSQIITRNSLVASPEKIKTTIAQIAASYEQPEEVIRWYLESHERLAPIESMVLEEEAIEWAAGQLETEEKAISFSDLLDKKEA